MVPWWLMTCLRYVFSLSFPSSWMMSHDTSDICLLFNSSFKLNDESWHASDMFPLLLVLQVEWWVTTLQIYVFSSARPSVQLSRQAAVDWEVLVMPSCLSPQTWQRSGGKVHWPSPHQSRNNHAPNSELRLCRRYPRTAANVWTGLVPGSLVWAYCHSHDSTENCMFCAQ